MIKGNNAAPRLAALLLSCLFYATVATAEDRPPGSTDRTNASAVSAPVGHRQPTVADVGKEQPTASDEKQIKRDRELDKRLQICRGC